VLRYFLNTESSTFFYVKTLMMTRRPSKSRARALHLRWNYEKSSTGAPSEIPRGLRRSDRTEYREDLYFNRARARRSTRFGQRILAVISPTRGRRCT